MLRGRVRMAKHARQLSLACFEHSKVIGLSTRARSHYVSHSEVTSPFPLLGNEGYVRNRDDMRCNEQCSVKCLSHICSLMHLVSSTLRRVVMIDMIDMKQYFQFSVLSFHTDSYSLLIKYFGINESYFYSCTASNWCAYSTIADTEYTVWTNECALPWDNIRTALTYSCKSMIRNWLSCQISVKCFSILCETKPNQSWLLNKK